jgi:hypothetical protein
MPLQPGNNVLECESQPNLASDMVVVSCTHIMTTVPNTATTQPRDNSRFMEDLDADMDVDPLGAPIKASSPSAFPPDEQPARNTPMGGKFMYVVLLTVVCFVLGVAEQLLCHTRKHEMVHRLPTNGVTDIHLTMIFMWITVPVLCTIFTIYQYHIYG